MYPTLYADEIYEKVKCNLLYTFKKYKLDLKSIYKELVL